jgi:hypothetical protein
LATRRQQELMISTTAAVVLAPRVEPEVDAEIEYGALTDDGLLREAVFKGVRDDLAVPNVKAPRLVLLSVRHPRIGVPRENILQLLPDAVAPSKQELSNYWTRVCTENLIRVDAVMEYRLSWRNDRAALFRSGRPDLAIQVEVAAWS